MKQFKKILCGVMLTSFVIIGSVSVFAFPDNNDGDGGGTDCNLYEERVSYTKEEAKRYKEVANADMQLNAGHIWGDDAGTDPPNIPGDTDDDGIPDIVYKLVYSNEEYIAECSEATEEIDGNIVEVVCTQRTNENIDTAKDAIKPSTTPDQVKAKYNYCNAFNYTIKYKYNYYEEEECDCLCPSDCDVKTTNPSHICVTSCQVSGGHKTQKSDEATKTTYQATGGLWYGNPNTLNWANTFGGTTGERPLSGTYESKDAAIAAINEQFGDDFATLYENRESQHMNITRTSSLIDENGVIETALETYYVYDDQNRCRYFARHEIISIIVEGLIEQGYYNVRTNSTNAYIVNGCRSYAVGYNMWYGWGGRGDNGSTAHNKLTDYYKYNDLFVKDNNTYAVLFPFSEIAKTNMNDTGKNVMDVQVISTIWNNNWNPIIIHFQEHIVQSELVEKNGLPYYKDVTIGKENGSVDVFLQNLTHPGSPFGTKQYFPLNEEVTGYKAFSAIRAKYDGKNDTLVYKYGDGSGMGFALNEGQSAFFSSGTANVDALYGIQGDNLVTATPYADVYTQRVFRVKEHRNLFAYVAEGYGNSIFSSGEYLGLRAVPENEDSCDGTWRALYNIYRKDGASEYVGSGSVTLDESSTGLTNPESAYINENIYSTMNDDTAGKPIAVGSTGFTYNDKEVITTIRDLLLEDYSYEDIFQDMIRKEANFVGLKTSTNGIRNAIWLNSENAGKIFFEAGTHPEDYREVPSHIKPSRTTGSTNLSSYGIEKNGIYVLAQARLDDNYTSLVTVPYNTSTIEELYEITTKVRYTICIGQHNCECEDINVLCECEDEIAGCPEPDACKENPSLPGCQSGTDCTETPDAPECGCYNDIEGDCGCPTDENGIPLESCDLWQDKPGDPTCIETGKPCTENPPGGITGGGSEEYFEKFYKPSSTITN